MKIIENIVIMAVSLCLVGNPIALVKSKAISERELISRLGNEELLELVFEQQQTIKQKNNALKRLLALVTGSSHLTKTWLNSEIVFNELLKDPKLLRAEIDILLERKNILLDEKDNQLAASDRKLKLLRVLCCAPMYVITHIEEVQKRYNLGQQCNDDEDSRFTGQSWFDFVSSSSDSFAESIQKQLKNRKYGMSPKKFCESIVSLLLNSKLHFLNFAIEFQRTLVKGDELLSPGKSGILKIEEFQLKAFNVLLKVLGFAMVDLTEDGELYVPLCENSEYLEKYYNCSTTRSTKNESLQ